MVLGSVEEPNVVFYEQSQMDVDASKAARHRVYQTVLMIKVTAPGVTDWAPYRAQPADVKRHPEAYARFLEVKGDVGSPSVQIVPGITANEAQELIDYGIHTLTKLCDAEVLPRHLIHLQASARRINEVFKHEKVSNETITRADASDDVPAPDRRDHPADVRRPVFPAGDSPEVGATPERLRPSGRLDSGPGITRPDVGRDRPGGQGAEEGWLTPNWNLSFGTPIARH
jgi:hypothetical protein